MIVRKLKPKTSQHLKNEIYRFTETIEFLDWIGLDFLLYWLLWPLQYLNEKKLKYNLFIHFVLINDLNTTSILWQNQSRRRATFSHLTKATVRGGAWSLIYGLWIHWASSSYPVVDYPCDENVDLKQKKNKWQTFLP